jgi:hypothetical protein
MATIKIYSGGSGPDSIEFGNAGEIEENEMPVIIDHEEHPAEFLHFNLTEDDAKELIRYLKDQFGINLNLIK